MADRYGQAGITPAIIDPHREHRHFAIDGKGVASGKPSRSETGQAPIRDASFLTLAWEEQHASGLLWWVVN